MLRSLIVGVIAFLLTLAAAHARIPGQRFGSPDPGVIRVGGTWHVIATGGLIRTSTDLKRWKEAGRLMKGGFPAWTGPRRLWAPEIHAIAGRYVCYYALPDRSGYHCLGASVAPTPTGPWRHLPAPLKKGRLVRDEGRRRPVGLIDPTFFRDPRGGKQYVLWKENSNALRPKQRTRILIQEVDPAGTALRGKARALLDNDRRWERDVVEAPTLVHRDGWYYLLYSGATYSNESYAVGVARSRSPLGPFRKQATPVLRSGPRFYGPGHQDVARGEKGEWLLFYHSWERAPGERRRILMFDELRWQGGWPRVHDGRPSGHGAG